MLAHRLDGWLSLITLSLVAVLTVTLADMVAGAISLMSGSGKVSSTLLGIALSVGLCVCQLALVRLSARRSAGTYILLSAFVIAALSAWHLTQSSEIGTESWWIGLFFGSILPLQSVLLGSVAGNLLAMAGDNWWRGGKKPRPSTLVLPQSQSIESDRELQLAPSAPKADDAVAMTQAPPPVEPAELVDETPVTAAIPSVSSSLNQAIDERVTYTSPELVAPARELLPFVSRELGVGGISVSGDRVTVRVKGTLSNNRWKDLHQQLRRVASVSWDDAQKLKSEGGGRERILTGAINFPALKGKKSFQKDARENARRRRQFVDSVLDRIAPLVEAFDR